MSNNRMYLQIKGNPGKKILLAKYYPSTGWYIFYDEKTLNDWFKKSFNFKDIPNNTWVDGQWGRTDLELIFEINSEEKEISRQNLEGES